MSDTVRSIYTLLSEYAEKTGRPFLEVAQEYAILLRPRPAPTDADGGIRYFESLERLYGDLATAYSGPPVSEAKGNRTKLLILRYF
jgi:NRPS condensation-like uncharacterized protein